MREGRELVRETKRFQTENRLRSWWALISTVVALTAAIGVACTAAFPWFVRLGASIMAALIHVRLFVIYHDYQHGAILQRSIAGPFFWVYGLLAASPASIWRHTHNHHHAHNMESIGVHSIGSYPILSVAAYARASRKERLFYRISRHPLTILCGYLTVFVLGFCVLPILESARKHWDAALSLAVQVGLAIGLALWRPDILLLGFILPTCIASALGSYLFYAQHNFPEAKIRPGREWDYVLAALESSSYIKMNPVMAWFTANIGYHHVHHLNAKIPFYRLPEAMREVESLQKPFITHLSIRDMWRCFRLKLWDPKRDRFVSFGEAHAVRSEQPEPAQAA
jgi:omega-6 fatty acid desaturase (delta-12 desaturase)